MIKAISGFENYGISSDGKVYNLKTGCERKVRIHPKSGYAFISFYNNGKTKTFMVHRLVGLHFLINPDNKPQINHINGIKSDNRVENLEWVTDSENKKHCYQCGLKDKNVLSKKVMMIDVNNGEVIREFNSANEASRIIGINQGSISNCCNGKCKSYKGYKWKYK